MTTGLDATSAGKLPGAVHLYIGEETVVAGACAHLEERDISGGHASGGSGAGTMTEPGDSPREG